jgi:hypothetical protein
VVDPDDHHLYATLGCAVENIVIAANAHGIKATVHSSSPETGISIQLTDKVETETAAKAKILYEAIPKRHTSRTEYDGSSLEASEMELLRQAGEGNGVHMVMLTEKPDLDTVAEYVAKSCTAQMLDNNFIKELVEWIRFHASHALDTGDGLYGKTMGKPDVPLPPWAVRFVAPFVISPKKESAQLVKQIHSSAGVAIFVTDKDDSTHWVEVGRCYQRFALQATILLVRNAHINMPVELATIRPEFMKALHLDQMYARVDLVVRFGRGPEAPPSLRRPLEDVIITQEDKQSGNSGTQES